MDALLLQLLNGFDKGGAYALIALGLTVIFGTLGVVNFAHGALFMMGAFCAVTFQKLITLAQITKVNSNLGFPVTKKVPYLELWWGKTGTAIIDLAIPLSILMAIPVMALIGILLERGLIRHFYKRTHAEQILVTFGMAIVLQEIIKAFFGANPITVEAPAALSGTAAVGEWFGLGSALVYPWWRLVYLAFSIVIIAAVFAFLRFTTWGMVVRAGMMDRETVGLLGINIQKRFTIVFGMAAVVAGLAGLMAVPILKADYNMGMDWLVLSFVVVVVGGMGSLPGAVVAGFMLGIVQSFAAWLSSIDGLRDYLQGLDQIIIYLVAVVVLLVLPRGLMGRRGVMED